MEFLPSRLCFESKTGSVKSGSFEIYSNTILNLFNLSNKFDLTSVASALFCLIQSSSNFKALFFACYAVFQRGVTQFATQIL